MKKLLVIVDYQNDFVIGSLANKAVEPLENGICTLCDEFLSTSGYLLFTRDTHDNNYLKTREGKHLPITHCIKHTDGWNLTKKLQKYESTLNTLILNKPTFGCACIASEAEKLCGGKPDEIHICGVVTDICVISNAILLHSAFLAADCYLHKSLCAAITNESHENACAILSGMGWKIL